MPSTSYSAPLMKTISLPSGGRISLSFEGDLFQLSKEDREFVYSLLDAMTAHVAKEREEIAGIERIEGIKQTAGGQS